MRLTKTRSITKYYKIRWNDLPPHQQSSHEAELLEALNQHAQPLEKNCFM